MSNQTDTFKQQTSPVEDASLPARRKWNKRYAASGPQLRRTPTLFVRQCLPQLPTRGRALDIAAGAGRHSLALAQHGLRVDAVDVSGRGLQLARQRALTANFSSDNIQFIVADVERAWLPRCQYMVILVTFFLHRPLFPLIKNRLLPGGWLVYQTFTNKQIDAALGRVPSKQEFLLNPGELKQAFSDFELLVYAENRYRGRPASQLLARNPVNYDSPHRYSY